MTLHSMFTLGRNHRNQTLGLLRYSNAFWVMICIGEQPSQIFSSLQMKMLLALFLQLYLMDFQVNKWSNVHKPLPVIRSSSGHQNRNGRSAVFIFRSSEWWSDNVKVVLLSRYLMCCYCTFGDLHFFYILFLGRVFPQTDWILSMWNNFMQHYFIILLMGKGSQTVA